MIAYKSKMNTFVLLIFSILFLALGIWSIWFEMLMIYKVLSLIFTCFISTVLFYSFIYYIRSPKEVFAIYDGKLIIYKNNTNVTYDLLDIKEVSFNFNVPYWCLAFTFSIIKYNDEEILLGLFISKKVKVYKMMKQILIDNNIKITRAYYL